MPAALHFHQHQRGKQSQGTRRSPRAQITSMYTLCSHHTPDQQSCTPQTAPQGCAPHPACCSLDVVCGPFNGVGQRSPLVSSGMKVIKGDICQVAVHFLQLLKDDNTLLLHLRILQCTVLHKVTQKLYSCNTIPKLASHCLTATQCC